MNAPMTNLNTPTLRELAALNEQDLDAAIERHFGPRRHTSETVQELRQFIDAAPAREPMPFEPIWYERRASAQDEGDGSNQDGGMEALAYVMLAAVFAAVVAVMTRPAWWPL